MGNMLITRVSSKTKSFDISEVAPTEFLPLQSMQHTFNPLIGSCAGNCRLERLLGVTQLCDARLIAVVTGHCWLKGKSCSLYSSKQSSTPCTY